MHDYAGHPFPVELSKELANRGYDVIHAYFAGDRGPKGDLTPEVVSSHQLEFRALSIARPYSKTSLYRRRFDDVDYGRSIARLIYSEKPDIVLSGNTPTESQEAVVRACAAVKSAFVYWMQDFYSVAAASVLRKKLGWLGVPVSSYYQFLERRQLERADAVVVITEDFIPLIKAGTTDHRKIFTIYNWGPSSYVQPLPKVNDWSRRHGFQNSFNFLYSGTLGLKHNPSILSTLAAAMTGKANVIVASEGSGSVELARLKQAMRLDNLLLFPLQDFGDLPQVLATADVAIALLEEDAGVYSVPSKVLSYLCSSRPILVSAPAKNLAARIVDRSNAGLVVDPRDADAFIRAAGVLFDDHTRREEMGRRGSSFAMKNFSIGNVANNFEGVFNYALGRRSMELSSTAHRLVDRSFKRRQ